MRRAARTTRSQRTRLLDPSEAQPDSQPEGRDRLTGIPPKTHQSPGDRLDGRSSSDGHGPYNRRSTAESGLLAITRKNGPDQEKRSHNRKVARLSVLGQECPRTVQVVELTDSFVDLLIELCADSVVVAVESRSRHGFDAVLLACDRQVLIYEGWSRSGGLPTGELGVINLDDVDAILVS
jgi:hypothetical protein